MVNHLSPVLGLQYCSFSVKEGEFVNLGSLPAEAPALLVATVEIVIDFILGAPKSLQMMTAAIKLRHLLLGRKVMTSLDIILKSRDITLPTKVHLVKAMVFPVVMYGCESWTVKKAER